MKLTALLASLSLSAFAQNADFKVQEVDLGLNIVEQVIPDFESTNIFYLTNNVNSMQVKETVWLDGFVGKNWQLSWNSQPTTVYIVRKSTNNVAWKQIPIYFVGDGKPILWYENLTPAGVTNYFQLVIVDNPPPNPPTRLRTPATLYVNRTAITNKYGPPDQTNRQNYPSRPSRPESEP